MPDEEPRQPAPAPWTMLVLIGMLVIVIMVMLAFGYFYLNPKKQPPVAKDPSKEVTPVAKTEEVIKMKPKFPASSMGEPQATKKEKEAPAEAPTEKGKSPTVADNAPPVSKPDESKKPSSESATPPTVDVAKAEMKKPAEPPAEPAKTEPSSRPPEPTADPVDRSITGKPVVVNTDPLRFIPEPLKEFAPESKEGSSLVKDALARIDEAPPELYSDKAKSKVREGLKSARRIFKIDTIHFDKGGDLILPVYKDHLKKALEEPVLTDASTDPRAVYFVLGFADKSGAADTNKKLSLTRANTVIDLLKNDGVINITYPVAIGPSEIVSAENQEKNRAAEVWLVLP